MTTTNKAESLHISAGGEVSEESVLAITMQYICNDLKSKPQNSRLAVHCTPQFVSVKKKEQSPVLIIFSILRVVLSLPQGEKNTFLCSREVRECGS